MATFTDPVVAVEAAAQLQAALADVSWRGSEPLSVRVSVHSGGVHERGGDLYGSAANRAARLVGLCPPGAVVVSEVTAGMWTVPSCVELGPELGESVMVVGEVEVADGAGRSVELDARGIMFASGEERCGPVEVGASGPCR